MLTEGKRRGQGINVQCIGIITLETSQVLKERHTSQSVLLVQEWAPARELMDCCHWENSEQRK